MIKSKSQAIFWLFPSLLLIIDLSFKNESILNFGLKEYVFYILSIAYSFMAYFLITQLIILIQTKFGKIAKPLTIFTAFIYASIISLSYGYSILNGTLPNTFIFEFCFSSSLNAWTIFRDSIKFYYIFIFILVFLLIYLLLNFSISTRKSGKIRAIPNFLLVTALIILTLFFRNNLRHFGNCSTIEANFTGNIMFAGGNKLFGTKSGIQKLQPRHPIKLTKQNSNPKFNILVILTESLRKQNMGVYGYQRETTPFLKKLINDNKEEMFVFQSAFSNASYTQLSQPSILTGILPAQEAELFHLMPIFWDYAKSCNYQTFYITSHSMGEHRIDYISSIKSIDHPWYEEINHLPFYNDIGTDDRVTVKHFREYIAEITAKNEKFAGVLQFNANHYPYTVPQEFDKFGDEWHDRYDESILYQDWLIQSAFEALIANNLMENTIIFIISDHGQAFREHKLTGHIECLYYEGIAVPFIIYIPKELSRDFPVDILKNNTTKNISNVDFIPTIIDMLDVEDEILRLNIKKHLTGSSLFTDIDEERYILICNENETQRVLAGASIIHKNHHFLYRINKSPHSIELFDILEDRQERKNLWSGKNPMEIDYFAIMRKFPNTSKILE